MYHRRMLKTAIQALIALVCFSLQANVFSPLNIIPNAISQNDIQIEGVKPLSLQYQTPPIDETIYLTAGVPQKSSVMSFYQTCDGPSDWAQYYLIQFPNTGSSRQFIWYRGIYSGNLNVEIDGYLYYSGQTNFSIANVDTIAKGLTEGTSWGIWRTLWNTENELVVRILPNCYDHPQEINGTVQFEFILSEDNPGTTPQSVPAKISLTVEDDYLKTGECTRLDWYVNNASEVRLDNTSVYASDHKQVCPISTTTYTMDALGSDGYWASKSVTVNVEAVASPATAQFWADTTSITRGECTYLHWATSNASQVKLDSTSIYSSNQKQICPTTTTTYRLDVQGADEQWTSKQLTVNVDQPIQAASADFWVDSPKIEKGSCTYLHWTTSNANQMQLDNGSVNSGGDKQICPSSTTTYSLKVQGSNGQWTTKQVTVKVDAPPQAADVQFTVDAIQLKTGECTKLHWRTQNATNATLNDLGVATSADAQVCPGESMDYTLNVTGQNGEIKTSTIHITLTDTECKDIENNILIVSNSVRLNWITNDSSAWEKVKDELIKYYSNPTGECIGQPIFLDLSTFSGGDMSDPLIVDQVIEQTVSNKYAGKTPAAVAIIGGTSVVPIGRITVLSSMDPVATDDVYADFTHDPYQIPDTVITRLPDGSSSTLLLNFIQRLAANPQPPAGSSLILPIQKAYERLLMASSATMRYATGQATQVNHCYLEDTLQASTGSNDLYLAPPWSTGDAGDTSGIRQYIPANDPLTLSGLGNGNIGGKLNKKDLVIAGLTNLGGNYNWSAKDFTNLFYIPVFTVNEAKTLPQGAQIFAIVSHSADLVGGGGQTPASSIPLAALANEARYFIGTLGEAHLANLSDSFVPASKTLITDLDPEQYDLRFANTFFHITNCDQMGTAARFLSAKIQFSSQGMNDPINRQTVHTYIYYGLPEKFTSQNKDYCEQMEKLDCTAKQWQPQPPPPNCPSGIAEDCDGDGLTQVEETWVANTFKPIWYLDEHEPSINVFPSFIYQVTNFPQGLPQGFNRPGVVLTINALYVEDIATISLGTILGFQWNKTAFHWHWGDNEVIEIWLSRDFSACTEQGDQVYDGPKGPVCYSMRNVVIHRHEHADSTILENSADKFFDKFMLLPGVPGTHLMLFVSRGKHAVYPTSYFCRLATYQATLGGYMGMYLTETREMCSDAEDSVRTGKVVFPNLDPSLNVGEKRFPLLVELEKNPLLSRFPYEKAWGDIQFCGGTLYGEGDLVFINPLSEATIIPYLLSVPEIKPCGGSNESKWCGSDSTYCGQPKK